MRYSITAILLFAFSLSYAQADLINENFDNGLPSGWIHCSGNWGASPQWMADSGALRESSGPYFGGVLNAIVLPPVNLTSITNPFLGFDLAMAVIDTNIQLSVWYTTDSDCSQVWDTVNNRYIIEGWQLLSTYGTATVAADNSWKPSSTDYQTISIDLSQLNSATDIRFCLASDYRNAYSNGVWYLDNVRIYSNTNTGLSEHDAFASFRLIPNPANKVVRFISDKPTINAVLRITDITGAVVFERSIDSAIGEIDVSRYTPGIYLVQHISRQTVSIEKLIIH